MQEIVSTDFYSIHVDKAKNRPFLVYRGSWIRDNQVPNFVKDHELAVRQLSRGFTALVDVRSMEAMLLSDLIEQVQRDAIKAGIRKAARVYDMTYDRPYDRPTFIQVHGVKGS